MGRTCSINVIAWDAGREKLIVDILTQQASQHKDFAKKIVKHANKIVENSIGDKWWVDTLPRIWAKVKRSVIDSGIVSEDEAVAQGMVGDDDDENQGEEEEVHHKKLKRLAKASTAEHASPKKLKKETKYATA